MNIALVLAIEQGQGTASRGGSEDFGCIEAFKADKRFKAGGQGELFGCPCISFGAEWIRPGGRVSLIGHGACSVLFPLETRNIPYQRLFLLEERGI